MTAPAVDVTALTGELIEFYRRAGVVTSAELLKAAVILVISEMVILRHEVRGQDVVVLHELLSEILGAIRDIRDASLDQLALPFPVKH